MNVLITGAAGGIGKKLVHNFAARPEINVIAVSRSEKDLKELKQEVLQSVGSDLDIIVSDFSAVGFEKKLFSYINERYGSLTYLINNAGVLINKPFDEQSDQDLSAQLHVNFVAPFRLIRSFIPLLKKSEQRAHVVNIGSMGGFQGSTKFPGLSAYSASKAALANLTECLGAEYAAERISFNCLALGSTNTEMLRAAFPGYSSKTEPERMAEFIVNFTLKGSEFINGKVIPVAGTET